MTESEQVMAESARDRAVKAAKSFHWEGKPLHRNLIEEVLNEAEPVIRADERSKLEEALKWALGWIKDSNEVPLREEEADDYALYIAASALVNDQRTDSRLSTQQKDKP